ncbi:Acid phosphatase type 7 [Bagarius yarrelli]|uniref:Acid phosphatase type 7 n=1 Tax=Bagarius yarrelli TaxID=175774 RepID=A0A556UFF0_BAGYA|nr:Acid phosphatase type 7 [Bagarius yarrelli]
MAVLRLFLFCGLLSLVSCVPPIWSQPEQVHISYPGVKGSMVITWTTFDYTESVVEYDLWGGKLFSHSAKGNSTLFIDGGSKKRKMYMHKVTLTELTSGAKYVYHCGSEKGWSDIFFFTALNDSTSFSPRFALFGDLGNENPQSLARLQKETQAGMYDVILHIVDDLFYSLYSWNIGSAHIISFTTEVYFYLEYGLDLLFEQYKWLQKDLEEANKPENRAERPWIITMAHRPMYCSNNDQDDCTKFESYVRHGRSDTKPPAPGLEDLFYQHELWAHEHTYERLWPVYNYKVYNGSVDKPYVNPKAPVHIITGSAGCREKHDGFIPKPRDWSAFRSTDYGYTRMHLINSTHIYLEQVSDDQTTFKTLESSFKALHSTENGCQPCYPS